MTYVVGPSCIDVKDGACQDVCPVDAIHAEAELPGAISAYLAVNAEFFGDAVTGWGSPRGADAAHVSALDHPAVARAPRAKL